MEDKHQSFTPETIKAEQERKRRDDERKQRRQDIENEIKAVKNEIHTLSNLPPDIEQMVSHWSQAIDAESNKFVSDMQIEARKGRIPELRVSARGMLQYFNSERMKDDLMRLACEVAGDRDTASKQAQLGIARVRLNKLTAELNSLSG